MKSVKTKKFELFPLLELPLCYKRRVRTASDILSIVPSMFLLVKATQRCCFSKGLETLSIRQHNMYSLYFTFLNETLQCTGVKVPNGPKAFAPILLF